MSWLNDISDLSMLKKLWYVIFCHHCIVSSLLLVLFTRILLSFTPLYVGRLEMQRSLSLHQGRHMFKWLIQCHQKSVKFIPLVFCTRVYKIDVRFIPLSPSYTFPSPHNPNPSAAQIYVRWRIHTSFQIHVLVFQRPVGWYIGIWSNSKWCKSSMIVIGL